MTDFEDTVLGYVSDYVDDNCFGNIYYAAKELGVSHMSLGRWLEYYLSEGSEGCSPQLHKIGSVLDAIGVRIITSDRSEELHLMLSSLESAVFYFLDKYITDNCCGSRCRAARKLGFSNSQMYQWMDYHKSGGNTNGGPLLNNAARILDALKVSFKTSEDTYEIE